MVMFREKKSTQRLYNINTYSNTYIGLLWKGEYGWVDRWSCARVHDKRMFERLQVLHIIINRGITEQTLSPLVLLNIVQ